MGIIRRPGERFNRGRAPRGGASAITPATILGSALLAWFRADLGITLNGSNVSAWADQSGNGHHLIQNTATNQPAFEAAGLGGKPSVLFDGVDNYLVSAASALGAACGGNDQPVSLIMAYHLVSATANDTFWSFTNTADADSVLRIITAAGPTARSDKGADDGGFVSAAGTIVLATTEAHVHSFVHSGTAVSTWIDGTIDTNNQALNVNVTNFDRFILGAQAPTLFFNNARYAEVVISASALSTAKRQAIEDYMQARYGTP